MKPIYKEINYIQPFLLYSKLSHQKWSLLLDSDNGHPVFENTNKYSYICFDPFDTLLFHTAPPWQETEKKLAQYTLEKEPTLPPFQGGMAGYLSYDLCHHIENIPYNQESTPFPLLAFGLYDIVVSFNHQTKQSWIVSTGFPATSEKARLLKAKNRLKEVELILNSNSTSTKKKEDFKTIPISSNFTKPDYLNMIGKCKNYILDGDIFEINVSQQFQAKLPSSISAFELYWRLKKVNQAPFSAYFNLEDIVIASASPERFLKLENSILEARPIKGTMPRGNTAAEDKRLADKLLSSKKDKAENTMIVDLMRNDFSKVCEPNSVCVEKLCGLESHPNVHHLVSVVTGQVKTHVNCMDIIKACFPGGSITGAPKIRAMELISQLEPVNRGPYCGSMGFISFCGEMDLSILIRSYTIKNNIITFHTGGAITLDSDPEQEYQETLAKAKGLIQALNGKLDNDSCH